ncbi:MAG TPA: hypothetical protein VJV78_03800 [Polyangiales bacterium]|nr:hypothetical protein [Polyangiales bacterium]
MLKLRRWYWLCFVCLLGCEPSELIMNPMVDRWCGERPCSWEVEGKIKRVGTWHTHDFAVEFVSDQATLSQVNEAVDANDTDCFSFSMLADVDSRARVFLELDFLNDGSAEFSQRLPPGSWARRTFLIRTPSWYEGVRFIIRKDGPGHVVLAELRARPDSACTGPAVVLKDRPAGAACNQDDDCQGGRCAERSCSFCRDDSECASDEICALVGYRGTLVEQCTKPHRSKLGKACSRSDECESSVCCEGLCSQCCPGQAACPDDVACERGQLATGDNPSFARNVPFQCGPGMFREPRGAPCTAHQDCHNVRCEGTLTGCDDLGCKDVDADAGIDAPNCESLCPKVIVTPGTCS